MNGYNQGGSLPPAKRQPKRRHRLPHGEGSFYWRESDGRWVGSIEAGYNAKGIRRRITVTDRDEDRAWDKLMVKRKQLLTEGRAAALQRSITVQAWLTQWLEHQATVLRPNTYNGHATYVRRWIIPTIGRRPLDELTAGDVRTVARAVMDGGGSSTYAGTIQGVLQKALRDAIAEGYMVPEAPLLVQKPSKAENDRDALALPDAAAVLKVASTRPDGARWVAALLQGMRQGECLGLTWDAVDFEHGRIDISWQLQSLPYKHGCLEGGKITCGTRRAAACPRRAFRVPDGYEAQRLERSWHLVRPKSTKSQRVIPMLDWMAEPLRAWRKVAPVSPHGLVWPRPDGQPQNDKADREAWYALCEEAGVRHPAGRPYLLHECRNTTASLLSAAGVSDKVITDILGHASIVTSRGYMSIDFDQMREALMRATARVLPAAGG